MKIALGCDHAGYPMKRVLKERLEKDGHHVTDFGTYDTESCDYPDYASAVATSVSKGESEYGLLICGTGIGMSIAANKIAGVRAALVHDLLTARLAREHNNANVLTFGGRIHSDEYAYLMVKTWLEASFEDRHQRRIDKITHMEREQNSHKK